MSTSAKGNVPNPAGNANPFVLNTAWDSPQAQTPAPTSKTPETLPAAGPFLPPEPTNLAETGLTAGEVESLTLKALLNQGVLTGRKIASQLRIPFGVVTDCLVAMKQQMLVRYKAASAAGDYDHELTDQGTERARRWAQRCTFSGAAPVPLQDYTIAVQKQALGNLRLKMDDLRRAYSHLLVPDQVLSQIGQSIHAGRGLFLFGPPGNGKTSIAERLIDSLDQTIWIPRTLTVGGEIIRVFDPSVHKEVPFESTSASTLLKGHRWDQRWVRIKRPTIIVGGEMTMSQLEFNADKTTGIIESPLQIKCNGGALVIDDFGRQKFSISELLNRFIVPLEKHYDYLTLPSGRQIQVPYDQMFVVATNMPPSEIVDEAFLRRMPYKIEMPNPTEAEFVSLFERTAQAMKIKFNRAVVEAMIEQQYRKPKRPFRFCHARDLLNQVHVFCDFTEQPRATTEESLQAAAKNYFAGF